MDKPGKPKAGSGPGNLKSIWIKPARGAPMNPVTQVQLMANHGLAGNADVGGKRQVTLLEKEIWERVMGEMGASLDPSTRRANLMISGMALADTGGRILCIGQCRLRISGESKPCYQMDDALPGLRQALYDNWHGGALAEVLQGGTIALGDALTWEK